MAWGDQASIGAQAAVRSVSNKASVHNTVGSKRRAAGPLAGTAAPRPASPPLKARQATTRCPRATMGAEKKPRSANQTQSAAAPALDQLQNLGLRHTQSFTGWHQRSQYSIHRALRAGPCCRGREDKTTPRRRSRSPRRRFEDALMPVKQDDRPPNERRQAGLPAPSLPPIALQQRPGSAMCPTAGLEGEQHPQYGTSLGSAAYQATQGWGGSNTSCTEGLPSASALVVVT